RPALAALPARIRWLTASRRTVVTARTPAAPTTLRSARGPRRVRTPALPVQDPHAVRPHAVPLQRHPGIARTDPVDPADPVGDVAADQRQHAEEIGMERPRVLLV